MATSAFFHSSHLSAFLRPSFPSYFFGREWGCKFTASWINLEMTILKTDLFGMFDWKAIAA